VSVIISERKTGVILGYLSIAIRNIVGLLIIPFIIHHVGINEYGIYSIVTTLSGYLIILELGLANTVIRFISKYKADQNKDKESQFLSTVIVIYGVITCAVLFAGSIIWFKIPDIFSSSLNKDEIALLQPSFLVLLISISITLLSNSFTGVISAYERFKFQKSIEILVFILRCVLVVICLELDYGVFAIVIIDTLINALHAFIRFLFVKYKLNVYLTLSFPDMKVVKEILFYTFFIALNVIVNQINWRVDNLIIGTIEDARSVGIFNIGNQLVFCFIAFAAAISNVFTPKIVKMVTLKATSEQLTDEIIRIGRLQMIVLGFILVTFVAYGSLFIDLFVGRAFEQAYWVALLPMIPFIFVLAQTSTNSVLQAMNKHKARSLLLLISAMLNILFSIVLVKKIGMIGASIGTATTLFIGELILVNIYLVRVIGLDMIKFYRVILLSNVPIIAISLFFSFGVLNLINSSWMGLILGCCLTGLIYTLLTYTLVLTKYEKKMCINTIRRL